MKDICGMVKIKMKVGKYEFFLPFQSWCVTVPSLILIYLIPVCPEYLTA